MPSLGTPEKGRAVLDHLVAAAEDVLKILDESSNEGWGGAVRSLSRQPRHPLGRRSSSSGGSNRAPPDARLFKLSLLRQEEPQAARRPFQFAVGEDATEAPSITAGLSASWLAQASVKLAKSRSGMSVGRGPPE